MANDTVFSCPQQDPERSKEFIVVAHNPKSVNHTDYLRIQLPGNNYKPQVWNKVKNEWADSHEYDILEQSHFKNNKLEPGSLAVDYLMVLDYDLAPNEIAYVKISKSNEPYEFKADSKATARENGAILEITGFTDTNEALFRLTNRE